MVSFLTLPPRILRATIRHRVVVGYAVAPSLVAPRLPPGLAPDTRDRRAYVCVVGVQLVKVRVLGLSGPGFRRVPAVELQVLVREEDEHPGRRGTMTVQAYVPRRLVAWGARLLYGEPVAVASMQPVRRERGDAVEMTYRFDVAGREQRIRVRAEGPASTPDSGTLAHFLRERNWRYGVARDGSVLRARIERGNEPLRRVAEHHVTIRWGAVYGPEWADLGGRTPAATLFSSGSPVALRWRERGA